MSGARPEIASLTAAGCSTRRGEVLISPLMTAATVETSSPMPCLLRATVGTVGTPKSLDRLRMSTSRPLRSASSIRLTHSTTRSVISRTWRTRFRFRSKAVASVTTTVQSGRPKSRKLRLISSSWEAESSE